MTSFSKTLLSGALLASLPLAANAQVSSDSDVVQRLNALYYSTARDCGSQTRPAFLCSGLIVKATHPSLASQFHAVDPASQARGGVSVSYLRQDARFAALPNGATSGFIFNPVLTNPSDHADYSVLCAFPTAADTEGRQLNGCGDSASTPAVENFCDLSGIETAQQWITAYRTSGNLAAAGCAFDTRIGSAGTAQKFYQNLEAIRALGAEALGKPNEMMVAPWQDLAPRSPSLMALFYTSSAGIKASQLSQIQWFQASGGWRLPIVKLRLPQTLTQQAAFAYETGAQAIYPTTGPNQCARYVQHSEWVIRYDPGFRKNIATLSILPTDCARKVREDQTNNFFNELVAKHYLQPEWINNPDNPTASIPAMRRQLICHLMVERGKAYYNLEPSRPFADQARTNSAGCNNT